MTRGMMMAYPGASPAMKPVLKFATVLFPQFSLFDLGSRVANLNWAPVPIWVVIFLFGYMVFYSGGFVSLAWLKFRRQAV
jgi:hypothetical protein